MPTPGGHLAGEVASAMQKAIRRGEERDALYWASELELAGFSSYVWKRLRIIASEDVGVADSSIAVLVRTLYENAAEQKRDAPRDERPGQQGRLFLVHAIIALCRAPKSRIVDHALMVMYRGDRPRVEVPDYALDRHTARGRRRRRGWKHFFDVGTLLVNETLPDPYKEEARKIVSKEGKPEVNEQGELVIDP
jgi:replication-associated recombination protein RarA